MSCGDDSEALRVTSHVLPTATVGRPYRVELSAQGGERPYAFALTNGTPEVAEGLVLEHDGSIAGTPTEAGLFGFEVSATDAKQNVAYGGVFLEVRTASASVSPARTCSAPEVVRIGEDEVMLTGILDPREPSRVSGSCGFEESVEHVFELRLETARDLEIVRLSGDVEFLVRAGSCRSGTELFCGDRPYLVSLAPGTYFLMVEEHYPYQEAFSEYALLVRTRAPTPRPDNDRCSAAALIPFDGGHASLRGSVTAAEPDGRTCGDRRGLYYAFDVDVPSRLDIDEVRGDVSIEVLDGACSPLRSCHSGDTCFQQLSPGRHVFRVGAYTDYSRDFELGVSLTPIGEMPNNTICERAEPVDTSTDGATAVSASFAVGAPGYVNAASACLFPTEHAWDLFYRFELEETSDVAVHLFGPSSHRLNHALLSNGCGSPTEVACRSDPSGEHYRLVAGTYRLVIRHDQPALDGYCEAPTNYDFDLHISVSPSPPPPANDTCAGAEDVRFGSATTATVAGSTRGATDDVSWVQCPSYTRSQSDGSDVFYAVHLPYAARLRMTQSGLGPGVIASLHTTPCEAIEALACTRPSNPAFETPFALFQGTYYVRVEPADRSTQGPFSLLFELLSP